jgi:hypothetical protein
MLKVKCYRSLSKIINLRVFPPEDGGVPRYR